MATAVSGGGGDAMGVSGVCAGATEGLTHTKGVPGGNEKEKGPGAIPEVITVNCPHGNGRHQTTEKRREKDKQADKQNKSCTCAH